MNLINIFLTYGSFFFIFNILCMEPEQKIINRLQLLPLDVNNLIARYVAADFLNTDQPEFKKKILCPTSLTNFLNGNYRKTSLAFHPCEEKIAVIQQQSRSSAVKLVSTKEKESDFPKILCNNINFPICSITFNKDGSWLGISYEQYFYPYDTRTGKSLPGIVCSNSRWRRTHLFLPFHNRLINAHPYRISEWNFENKNEKNMIKCAPYDNMTFRHIAHDPENPGAIITTQGNDVVSLELATQTFCAPILTFKEAITSLAAANGTIAITTRDSLIMRNKNIAYCDGEIDGSYIGLAIHPNRPIIATLSTNGTIKLFDTHNGIFLDSISRIPPETIPQESFSQTKIAFSPCGNMMAIAFQDQYELWYFTTASKDWLKMNMRIPLAAAICRICETMKKEEYKLIDGSEDHTILTTPEIPFYVRDFLKHYLKISIS